MIRYDDAGQPRASGTLKSMCRCNARPALGSPGLPLGVFWAFPARSLFRRFFFFFWIPRGVASSRRRRQNVRASQLRYLSYLPTIRYRTSPPTVLRDDGALELDPRSLDLIVLGDWFSFGSAGYGVIASSGFSVWENSGMRSSRAASTHTISTIQLPICVPG